MLFLTGSLDKMRLNPVNSLFCPRLSPGARAWHAPSRGGFFKAREIVGIPPGIAPKAKSIPRQAFGHAPQGEQDLFAKTTDFMVAKGPREP